MKKDGDDVMDVAGNDTTSIRELAMLFTYAQNNYGQIKIEIEKCQDEIHEIEHCIEFEEVTPYMGYILALKIKEVRLRRRDLKVQRQLLEPIMDFIKSRKNLPIELYKLSAEVKRAEKYVEHAKYKPKLRLDLPFSVLNIPQDLELDDQGLIVNPEENKENDENDEIN